ncbi:MAG: N-acetyltransferase [Rhodospirillales bacterium]|nr:N-acetyltransferase [Rhodospirillales bacterium]
MPDGREGLSVKVLRSIADAKPEAWDACAGSDNPFISHAFLSALEDSGSATAKTGWLPQHLAIEDTQGGILAAAPLYLKSHSYGEYVFDWGWAEAYERAGGRYYPKLQSAVPFTPVTGCRLLVRPDIPGELKSELADALINAMVQLGQRLSVSSLHVTFPPEDEWARFGRHGFLQRVGQQFHWENRGYATFDDFLATLSSRKRKAIRKERESVAADGVVLRALTGRSISEAHWDAFHEGYCRTSDGKWGPTYLTRDFFSLLSERLGDRVLLVAAEYEGRPIAGALNLVGGRALYGRNWGCTREFRFLHFEACYYQAIEFAIARGLDRVEAGAQGPHKIQRGYLPCPTYSAHWIGDPGLRAAVARFLAQEQAAVQDEMTELAGYSPYRKGDAD